MISCIVHNADTQARTRLELRACHAGGGGAAFDPPLAMLGEAMVWTALLPEDDAGYEAGFTLKAGATSLPMFALQDFPGVMCGIRGAGHGGPLRLAGAGGGPARILIASLPGHIAEAMEREPGKEAALAMLVSELLVAAAGGDEIAALLEQKNGAIDALGRDASHALLLSLADMLRGFQWHDAEVSARSLTLARRPSRSTSVHLAEALVRARRFAEAEEAAAPLRASEAAFLRDRHAGLVEALDGRRALRHALVAAAAGRSASPPPSSRIAYCLHDAPPQSWGGYALRSHGIARAIAATGGEIVPLARPRFARPGNRSGVANVDGIDYRFSTAFGRRGRLDAYLAELTGYYAARFAELGVGIVQAASNYITALPAGLAAHRLGLPFIYEVRSFWNITREARSPGARETREGRRDRLFELATCALADRIATLTPAMAGELASRGIEPQRIDIVPNCVDTERVTPLARDAATAARYGIATDDVVIGYIGAMLGYEGLPMLVEAAAEAIERAPRARLLIVGAAPANIGKPGTVEQMVAEAIARRGIADRAALAPRVPHEEVRALYSVMDILAYPRLPYEVCELVSPLKPLEAMAMGKAVLASDVGGMRFMVEHGETGLVFAKGDRAALADALAELVGDAGLRDRLGRGAREFVVAERDWRHAAEELAHTHIRAREALAERPKLIRDRLQPILDRMFAYG